MKSKAILLFFSLTLLLGTIKAQVFSWKTNDSVSVVSTDGTASLKLMMTNISGDSLSLDWKLISNTFPSAWDVTLCDYNTCYIGIPDSGSMKKLGQLELGFLTLTVDMKNELGAAEMRFYVYDASDTTAGDTATFLLDASIATGIGQLNDVNKTQIVFPNPASDYVTLKGINGKSANVWIYDLNGKEIKSSTLDLTMNTQLSVQELNAGIYLIKVLDSNGQLFLNRMVKN